MTTLPKIKKVAVVGGGPAGVSVAKYLLAEEAFDIIDVFEQRSDAGGVWRYTPENDTDASFAIPSTNPNVGLEQPFWRHSDETSQNMKRRGVNTAQKKDEKRATFISPLYERLEANLPKMLMQHTDFAFPDDEQLFPTHAAITAYLEQYADDVRHLIHFETQVTSVSPLAPPNIGWSVTTRSRASDVQKTQEYDAVAIANGHFTVPFIPDLPGIKEWNERNPGIISHSKFYRRPDEFRDKKVLTIGSGYSGLDIASQVEPLCAAPLLHSTRSKPSTLSTTPSTSSAPADTATRHTVPSISRFLPDSEKYGTRAIEFQDGRVESSIDAVVFATGYLYSYPFLSLTPKSQISSNPAIATTMNGTNITTTTASINTTINTNTNPAPSLSFSSSAGERTPNTYHHIFNTSICPFLSTSSSSSTSSTTTTNPAHPPTQTQTHPSTLTYLTLPQKIVPFPTSSAQAAVIARVYSGRLRLPSLPDMRAWEAQRVAEKGAGKRFHYLDDKPGEDVAYVRMLAGWADEAGDGGDDGLKGRKGKVGKEPPRWGEKEAWMRERVGEIKKIWLGFGAEGRKDVRTLEACGFDYEKWKNESENGQDGDGDGVEVGANATEQEEIEKSDADDAMNGGQAEIG